MEIRRTISFGLTTYPGILNKLQEAMLEGDHKFKFRGDTGRTEEMIKMFKTIPLVLNKDDKLDAEAMFADVTDENVKAALNLQYFFAPSKYVTFKGGQKDNKRWCSLVPLVMFAIKEKHGITYEHWDKSNKYMPLALGYNLKGLTSIPEHVKETIRNLTPADVIELRENSLMRKGEKQSPLTYWTVQVAGQDWYNDLGNNIRHIVMQSWLANSTFRTEDMILDIDDWDKMPATVDTGHTMHIPGTELWL